MRFFIFFSFAFSVVGAQQYAPLDTLDHDARKANKELFTNKLDDFSKELDRKYASNTVWHVKKELEEFKTFFLKSFDRSSYVYNTPFNYKVDSIYKEIYLNNSNVPNDLQILVSRDVSLNARCLINGTLVVNMGAIHFLENEDQLAAIVCHEVAHKLLRHSEKSIVESVSEKYSQKTKNENLEIKRQKYNRQKRAFSILKEKLYSKSGVNKKQELEADSLGYTLLKNTKYSAFEFLKALEYSSQFDTIRPANLELNTYKLVFDLPEQPFNDRWLEQEDFSQYDYVFEEKLSKDSLSDHPEMDERIKQLQKKFSELQDYKNQNPVFGENTSYQALRVIAKKEQVPSLFYEKSYGFCIYLALYRIQQNDMVDFHKEWLGKAFQAMYEARKSYMANKYLDRIDPKNQTESYQQFINFMWNLRLNEIEKIAIHFSKES
ncbi:MAG: M48 family metallopeptidase [Bacteroidota bacterium]